MGEKEAWIKKGEKKGHRMLQVREFVCYSWNRSRAATKSETKQRNE
jgi:hypothetical protein